LSEISKSLDINPSYLSCEFSSIFDNLSFGKYIRKLRKAIELLKGWTIFLLEIAYLYLFVQWKIIETDVQISPKSPFSFERLKKLLQLCLLNSQD
jgi:hypothetical protein